MPVSAVDAIVLSSSSEGGDDAVQTELGKKRKSKNPLRNSSNKAEAGRTSAIRANDQNMTVKNKNENKEKKKKKKKKKKKNKGVGENATCSSCYSFPTSSGTVGTCSFPMSRVWRLVRSEGANTAVTDTRTTHDAVFLINNAAEMFLEQLAKDAYANALHKHDNRLVYKNLSSLVCTTKRYTFLSDFIPEKVGVQDALKAKEQVEL